jgi:predicted membrane-bound spermidine synthase
VQVDLVQLENNLKDLFCRVLSLGFKQATLILIRMACVYIEDNTQEIGVSHYWNNTTIKDSIVTKKGTHVEIVHRPNWGLACYMDNSIQSCEVDEKIYHESLVHPVMSTVSNPNRVMIIGGGEGATAREVLKWPGVKEVDMFEWDEEVVSLFKEKYPQWAKGAWEDERLKLHYVDIFQAIKYPSPENKKYDVIIIDLFDPTEDNYEQWTTLINCLNNWITPEGSIVMYAGMRNVVSDMQPHQRLIDIIKYNEIKTGIIAEDWCLDKEIIPYRVYIPSFSGESMFLLLKGPSLLNFNYLHDVESHITEDIWNSYKTLNW